MSALTQTGALWYASRATGITSLLLLTAVVLLGILVNRGGRLPGLPGFAVTGLHRNLSLLSVAFLAVHIVSVVLDPYVTIGWISVLVPWGGTYKPLWVGLGTVAFDLLLALVATSLLRLRMKQGTWRAIHWLAYAMWPVALAHGLGAGTDLRSGAMLALTIGAATAVALAAGWRLAVAVGETPRAGRVAPLLASPPARGAQGLRPERAAARTSSRRS
jgi:predicted ferric reductase